MEEMVRCGGGVRAESPWPEIRVQRRDLRYARAILSNVGGMGSEMSAVGLYLYDGLVLSGREELGQLFHETAQTEMRHLEVFSRLALLLGEEPRLWSIQRGRRLWWTPEYLQYDRMIGPLLQNAIRSEQAAIQKYESQARWIGDEYVRAVLRRVIEDETCHLEQFQRLWRMHTGR